MTQAVDGPLPGAAWHLRRAMAEDAEAVHALAAQPAVFRYLFDGAAPELAPLRDWLLGSAVFADLPSSASRAVMRRLGMPFLREARYALGAGIEYILRRGDPGPPRPIDVLPLK